MKVYPVVHIKNKDLAENQAELAISLGADGVFFINHHCDDELTKNLAVEFSNKHPEKMIGVNFLTLGPLDALAFAKSANIKNLWVDNAGIHSEMPLGVSSLLSKGASEASIKVFGGVAFKYQRHEPNPALAAEIAITKGFVPVTSGKGTGFAADIDKIKSMSEKAYGHLAVASGLDCNNIDSYKGLVEYGLVATGVSKNDYEFDENLLSEFINKAHEK